MQYYRHDPYHAGVRKIRDAVEQAEHWYNAGDWIKVGTADIAFHTAIVSLVGSWRLSRYFAQLTVELRLIFGLIDNPRYLHASYTHMNGHILELLEQDEKNRRPML